METQTSAKPNSYDVAVRIFKHFEERPGDHVITISKDKLREISGHKKLRDSFLHNLNYDLGYFDLLMTWGTEVIVISNATDFAPYTGGLAVAGEGLKYDESPEQDSSAD